jgi:hypothetical protein
MTSNIQRIEINTFYDCNIHCLFCGQKVLDYEDAVNPAHPCVHTLFIATDEGFEYRAALFDDLIKEQGIADEEDNGFDGYDAMTDSLNVVDGVKIAQYVGAPSGLGGYIGLAPLEPLEQG